MRTKTAAACLGAVLAALLLAAPAAAGPTGHGKAGSTIIART
jgi:hypothetical protein